MRAVLSCSPKMHRKLRRASSAGIAGLGFRKERVQSPAFKLCCQAGGKPTLNRAVRMGATHQPPWERSQPSNKTRTQLNSQPTPRQKWHILVQPPETIDLSMKTVYTKYCVL